MMRFGKFLLGLLLIPACVAATRAVIKLLLNLSPLAGFSPSTWGFVSGFALFVLLYLALPAPMKTYILAHELTHALWALAMGARVGIPRVGKNGGSVMVSKSNVLITLAPYFFPLYTVLLLIVYLACNHYFDLHAYRPIWYGMLGLTWAFHLVFTVHALRQRQPDIIEHGRIFSWALIYLINVLTLGVWICALAAPTLSVFGQRLLTEFKWVLEEYAALLDILRHAVHAIL